ncbi:DUF1015 domain-containing protein [Candidatus Magnetaquicoccus inordinatus]|uniref:DUF1015 domain-containing protein n=1 Tax=Candidatus Magnetaquicoccus inordinatus TaxID=2496818 RepID=UPI00102C7F92|nr:DUF1015 family protein [Candidatus Magnetaquicoccus inordinatus]
MKLIQPFAGWRPRPGLASEVAAPPYDVLSSQEARLLVKDHPHSFLYVSKAEIALDSALSPYDEQVYQTAAQRFDSLKEQGILQQDSSPCLYIYQLTYKERVQTGVVAAASIAAYRDNRIRKHELTRPDKENDRTRLAEVLSAHSGPVFLIYRHAEPLDALIQQIQNASPPDESFLADDGVHHALWVISDQALIAQLVELFEQQPRLYIADGHHRSAAAARVAERQPAADRFLAVIFPDKQLQILDYNRVVKDLRGLSVTQFLQAVQQHFHVAPAATAVAPKERHTFGLYVDKQWYQLSLEQKWIDESDPIASLDVALLDRYLLQPILGIVDPRRDQRIDFIGGVRGTAALQELVDGGSMAAAFSLCPTSLSELLAVADAGQIMPPKSTWFEPKLRDGLVVQTF